jgi:hypothetical protein
MMADEFEIGIINDLGSITQSAERQDSSVLSSN